MSGGKSAKRYSLEFRDQAARRVIENSLAVVQVARELGVNESTLGYWVKDYRAKAAGSPVPDAMPDRERMRDLERRNRELEMENAFLKKAGVPRTLEAA